MKPNKSPPFAKAMAGKQKSKKTPVKYPPAGGHGVNKSRFNREKEKKLKTKFSHFSRVSRETKKIRRNDEKNA